MRQVLAIGFSCFDDPRLVFELAETLRQAVSFWDVAEWVASARAVLAKVGVA